MDSSGTPAPTVFISYASLDRARVLAVADQLVDAGIRVWVDRRNIAGGSSWDTSIVQAIGNCTVFILACTPAALESSNVQQEVRLAWEERRPILPLMLDTVSISADLRYPLAGRQWVELLDRTSAAWLPEVLSALAGLGVRSSLSTATTDDPPVSAGSPLVAGVAVHLPQPLTRFIGREQDLGELTTILRTARLVTLTGPGGTGKTRLALTAARHVAGHFPDGAWFVDLSGVVEPSGVLPAVAQALGVRESEGRSLAVSLAAYLRRKRLLLVLDNFEQVVAAAMALYDLLADAAELVLLVTSRILLRIGGEQEYRVPPLPLPDARAAGDPAALRENAAVQLFLDRAQTLPDLGIPDEELRAIGAVCARLDGLPLAIELAAARVKLLSPTQLLERLERRLPLLTGGARSLPARQQTLRATIAWSWDLLSQPERILFRRLSMFAGGFTLAAAEGVCNPAGDLDVLEGLAALVDQSLVRQSGREGEPRFALLATLQEFAAEQLEAAGERDALQRAHATYYCALAEQADATWWRRGGARQGLLRLLDAERDYLVLALSWTVRVQDATLGLRFGAALGIWYFFRAPAEGQQWFERLLAMPGAIDKDGARGRTLFSEYCCATARGQMHIAIACLEEAATCLRAAEDLAPLSRTLAFLAAVLAADDMERAEALAEEALHLARAVGETYNLAYVEIAVGRGMTWRGGDATTIRGYLEEGLHLARGLDADWLCMAALVSLAEAERDPKVARALWYEAMPLAEALGEHFEGGHILSSLALLAESAGEHAEAAALWRRALGWAEEIGSDAATAFCLAGVAGLLTRQGRSEAAVRLLAASDRRREVVAQNPFYGPSYQTVFSQAQAATEAALSAEALARAAAQPLSQDQATDLAIAELRALTAPDATIPVEVRRTLPANHADQVRDRGDS